MQVLGRSYHPDGLSGQTVVRSCSRCGWWTVWDQRPGLQDIDSLSRTFSLDGATAHLKALDAVDISSGFSELHTWLLAAKDRFQEVHPRVMEETVASVFRDHGYQAVATGYSGDHGIDVILHGDDGSTIGIQVKNTRRSIEAEQIRSLAGALVLGGHTRGVFVTTSRFRSGAWATADAFTNRGIPIELVDADRFLDAIGVTQREPFWSYEEWDDIVGRELELASIYENESSLG